MKVKTTTSIGYLVGNIGFALSGDGSKRERVERELMRRVAERNMVRHSYTFISVILSGLKNSEMLLVTACISAPFVSFHAITISSPRRFTLPRSRCSNTF
jgi:hypothetical protein